MWDIFFNNNQNSKIISFAFSGPRLKGVTLDAFEGIDSYELLLAIRDSSLEELPMHFYTVIYSGVLTTVRVQLSKLLDSFWQSVWKVS